MLSLDSRPLDPARIALVLIDLQQGITGFGRAPHDSATVLANAAALADRFHALNALVVRGAAEAGDALLQVDQHERDAGGVKRPGVKR